MQILFFSPISFEEKKTLEVSKMMQPLNQVYLSGLRAHAAVNPPLLLATLPPSPLFSDTAGMFQSLPLCFTRSWYLTGDVLLG